MTNLNTQNLLFYLVVPPGLESLAKDELVGKFPGLIIDKADRGGILVSAPLGVGLALCTHLKIPTMVLLRIAEFKCRDLPKLYQKVSNIRWGQYILGDRFTLHVTSSQSRLLHEKKIAKSVTEGILRHFEKQPPKKLTPEQLRSEPFEIYVRFFDDICTMSLNLCGELLYKRGYKELGPADSAKELGADSAKELEPVQRDISLPKAPIRENLAAALYLALLKSAGPLDALLDPICGSGTFLHEAKIFYESNLSRTYAFQNRKDWVEAQIASGDCRAPQLIGFDRDEKVLQRLKSLLPEAQVFVGDFFDPASFNVEPFISQSKRLAIISNPPYGVRIRLSEKPSVYYDKWIQQALNLNPVALGVVLPKQALQFVQERYGAYTAAPDIHFENGGIAVCFRQYFRAKHGA
jgi:putative N6-adenine-specific DNA methylase